MEPLTPEQRRFLRALGHHLQPTVSIGQHGLTPAVLRELARTLDAHELVKIRVYGDDRDARLAFQQEICSHLDAIPVQHIGKLLLIYRPNPEQPSIVLPKTGKKGSAKSA